MGDISGLCRSPCRSLNLVGKNQTLEGLAYTMRRFEQSVCMSCEFNCNLSQPGKSEHTGYYYGLDDHVTRPTIPFCM